MAHKPSLEFFLGPNHHRSSRCNSDWRSSESHLICVIGESACVPCQWVVLPVDVIIMIMVRDNVTRIMRKVSDNYSLALFFCTRTHHSSPVPAFLDVAPSLARSPVVCFFSADPPPPRGGGKNTARGRQEMIINYVDCT